MHKTFTLLFFILISPFCFSQECVSVEKRVRPEQEFAIYDNTVLNQGIISTTDAEGNPIYWILGEIVNAVLPSAANWICLKVVGQDNEKICDGISEGIAFITSLASTGKSVKKIIGETVELIAERGALKSSLRFATSSIETAQNIKSTMEAYQKLKTILWENITDNINRMNSYVGSVKISNKVKKTIQLNFSKDGIEWFTYTFYPGNSISVNFWEGYFKQNYGFCTGSIFCNYQLFTDKSYQIRYNKISKEYYLEEL